MKLPKIDLNQFTYDLPQEKIAKYPLTNRSDSKLLVYKQGIVEHHTFRHLIDQLPKNTLLCFNNTRVIPARLLFQKSTLARIEIFLLHPIKPSTVVSEVMESTGSCAWHCMVGNFKKWKNDQVLERDLLIEDKEISLTATITNREKKHITFHWSGNISFAEIIEYLGKTPLPPYLGRESEEEDKERYQTVYARFNGAVAAPTAGLHFTDQILGNIRKKGIPVEYLTLHVSAGTFQPIKEANVTDHPMHCEQVVITSQNVHNLIQGPEKVIAVGTTAMRTLESLYWFGVKLIHQPHETDFRVGKLEPYQYTDHQLPSAIEALKAVQAWMKTRGLSQMVGETEIFIFPGYRFRICKGLITNFHQPSSTLILLVAAFVGPDWRTIYHKALQNDYRFLSYGDSSLLLP